MTQVNSPIGLHRVRIFFQKNLIEQDEKIMELCNFAHPCRVLPENNNPYKVLITLLSA
jgi:hypothetical protein